MNQALNSKELRKFIITCFLITIITQGFGQEYLPCGLWHAEQNLSNKTSVAEQRKQLEEFTRNYITKMNLQPELKNGIPVYTIPVVFHIMHDYGNENVSEAQCLDALKIINEDFQKLNNDTIEVASPFVPVIADSQIEFKLAQLDPNGNCTDGITRHATRLTNNADDNVKLIVDWDHTKYLNIWVVKNIAFGAAGYAYYPGAGPNQDGIVILHNYFGSIGTSPGSNYARHTLTHEIGHYLNLRHTWGNSNSPGSWSNCNDDDLVFDTPNTIGVNNFSCDTNQVTCTPNVTDNVQNYMDYAACHHMFTEGQKVRMHAALNNNASGRDNLWVPLNLSETGTSAGYSANPCVPKADFTYYRKFSCEGVSVKFTDVSWNTNGSYSRLWSFPGGTPSTSTDSMPLVTYPVHGTYDVSLTVSNNSGSDILTRNGFVNVIPAQGTASVPFTESFESIILPGNYWFIDNDGGAGFQITSAAAYSGTKSMALNNNNNNAFDAVDVLITEGYNFSNLVNPTMTFKYAFATKNASTDNLRVYYSVNCGKTWVLRFNKSGSNLATVGNQSANFIPQGNSDWREESLMINALGGKDNVRFKFEFYNKGGNNLYIDDINLGGGFASVNDVNEQDFMLQVFPNPAHENFSISFNLVNSAGITVKVYNVLGECMESIQQQLQAGTHAIDAGLNLLPGFYTVMFTANGKVISKKLIIR